MNDVMVEAQTKEKLHAACDECRKLLFSAIIHVNIVILTRHTGTRKLKCSGETPSCDRCKRERIECIYSPQKQMGRPRKRRREGEPEEIVEILPAETPLGIISNVFPAISSHADVGLVSPSHFQDPNQIFDVSAHITSPSHNLSISDAFGVSPISSLE